MKAVKMCAFFTPTTSPKTASSTRTGCACRKTAMGSPCRPSAPGQTKIYEFQVIDRACPAWFHPHPMMRTAEQVAMGLAGLFYVTDAEEAIDRAWRRHRRQRRAGGHPGPHLRQQQPVRLSSQHDVGLPGRPHPGQRQSQRRPIRRAARLPPARAQRLQRPHLQAGLEQRHAPEGHRHRWRPAAGRGEQELRHADARRARGPVGRFQQTRGQAGDPAQPGL